ncbi:hypothetical protein VTK26DRAFT_11 [Humicola hyalothermophila]
MEADSRGRAAIRVKAEDDSGDVRMGDEKPSYRSWKKKYRKMRVVFDQKMHEGEELHRLEQKALATARRLAVQKDRLLDLLLDVNNSAQIPPEKRIDLSLDPPSDDDALVLDIDRQSTPPPGPRPLLSYKKLRNEVPHYTFASASERFPDLLSDLEAGRDSPADPARGQPHPPSFLTADDIDNYIWEIDTRLAHEEGGASAAASAANGNGSGSGSGSGNDKAPRALPPPLPTLAPLAHAAATAGKDSQRDFAVRNPTSVYNWLRKHAPRTFLQDGEHDNKESGGGGGNKENGSGSGGGKSGGGSERTPRGAGGGGGGGGSGGVGGGGSGSTRSKRASAAHSSRAIASSSVAGSFEDLDDEFGGGYGMATPGTGGGAGKGGKRKRVADDDPGYRPKGGSSRPAKKKQRKSEGVEGTPTVKKPRKSAGAGGVGGAGGRSTLAAGSADVVLSKEMED